MFMELSLRELHRRRDAKFENDEPGEQILDLQEKR
jgi:hypothetical protein